MPAVIPGKGNNTLTSAWADIWRVYEDACVLCAGLWMGSWRNGSFYSSSRQRGDWGAIHLEGDDDLSIRRKRDESYVYVRNLGMGIEGRPTSTRSPSENGTLHNRSHRHQRRTSAMSLWTWASGRTSASTVTERSTLREVGWLRWEERRRQCSAYSECPRE